MILLSILALSVVAVLYAVYVRDWLIKQPWAWSRRLFAAIEPAEIFLFKKSPTIFLARFKMAIGFLLMLLSQFGEVDLTPFMPLVPEAYAPFVQVVVNMLPLAITVVGWIDEKMRNGTTKPVDLVAIADKDITPEVADALQAADQAKAAAVEAVAVAKAA